MDFSALFKESDFSAFSIEHGIPVFIAFLFGIFVVYVAKTKLTAIGQKQLLVVLAFIPTVALIIFTLMKLGTGNFDSTKDLPLHLCRLLAIGAPLVYYYQNKYWSGIFYFWIIVGTFNAIVTPDVRFGYPHWEYFDYFLLHASLVIIPIYYILVFRHKIKLRDLWNTFWMSNLLVLITLPLNLLIGSNYMFTVHKPESATIMDHLGPWPWYIVSLQFIGLAMFFIAYLPFIFINKKSS